MKLDVMFSSKTDEWSTPQAFFDELDAEFHFTLDAAADATNHKCDQYYDKAHDGLENPWGGVTWCNPPYGRQIGKWVRKAYEEHNNNGTTVVMLLPARTDTKMSRVFDTGVNNSGVWVRFKEVENLAGIMAYAYVHRPIATNADRIRAMSDEELAKWLEVEFLKCPWCKEDAPVDPVTKECLVPHQFCWECTLDWLRSPAEVKK